MHIHSSYQKHHLKPKIERREAERINQEKIRQKQIEEEKSKQLQLEEEAQQRIIKNFGLSNTRNHIKCKCGCW
jgi:ribosomal protein L9